MRVHGLVLVKQTFKTEAFTYNLLLKTRLPPSAISAMLRMLLLEQMQ